MAVQKRRGKFRVQCADASGRIISATFSKKRDAEIFLEKSRRERALVRHGLEVPRESKLVIDSVQSWLLKREKIRAHGSVYSDASRMTRFFVKRMGLRTVQSITTKDIRDLLDSVQADEKWTNATRNRLRAALHKFFRDLFMDEEIQANPVSRVPLLEERPTRKSVATLDELAGLMASATAEEKYRERNRLFLTLLIFQGPRISEACALQFQDFDLDGGLLRFRRIYEQSSRTVREGTKGHSEGIIVPIFPRVRQAYLEYVRSIGSHSESDFIFHDDDSAGCLSTFNAKDLLRRWSTRAKIRNINPHLLRATFATLAEESGFSKEEIQKLMGHSTVLVTERYTRMRTGHLVERAKQVGFGSVVEGENVVKIGGKSG